MTAFRYTLLADGSSDRTLLPVINSVLNEIDSFGARGVVGQLAMIPSAIGLANRIKQAVTDYPFDVLFVHRDAERDPIELRFHRRLILKDH